MHRIDRLWAGSTVVTAVGPIDLPSPEELRRSVSLLARTSAASGVGRYLDPAARRWIVAEDLDAFAEAAVRHLPELAGEQLDGMVTRVLRAGRGGLPLTITTVGRYVVLNIDHALGDGYYVTMLLPAVVEVARTGVVPGWARTTRREPPLSTALWDFFGRHPRRVLPVLSHARRNPSRATAPVRPGAPTPWAPSVRCVVRRSTPAALADLKRWRKEHASGLSTVPLAFAAAEAARSQAGLRPSTNPLVLFDARRYTRRHAGEILGNFSTGLRVELTDPLDPRDFDAAMKRAAELGRPLTAMALGVIVQPSGPAPAVVALPVEWDVAYTHMGRPAVVNRMRWEATADDSRHARCYTGVLPPNGPAGVTMGFTEIGDRLTVTASFHDNVFEPDVVTEVLELLCTDPAGLLEAHRSSQAPHTTSRAPHTTASSAAAPPIGAR